MPRDNFNKATIDALKVRAAYICSNPECRCLTVAPSESENDLFIFNGVVSHITAAAVGGPRYDGSISSDERGGIKNGIFLCANCSIMIDKNGGSDYTADTLRSWKAAHEQFIKENFNKRRENQIIEVSGHISASGIGTVTGLDISKAARIMPGTIVQSSGEGHITGVKIH